MNPSEFLDGGTVIVAPETYAVLTTDRPVDDAFATVQDGTETTVVAVAGQVPEEYVLDAEPGWRRLTFDATLPFELVGFLAAVATALARVDVSIFALSSYSTDHVLVKDTDLERATEALEALGCRVRD